MLTSKSIVLVNQFTNKNNSGHGKTPSSFVTDYMARNDATLTSYPVTNADNTHSISFGDPNSVFQMQQQKLLTRKAHYSRKVVTSKSWDNLTTLEGRGFNQNSLSLSKAGIQTTANELQHAFDQGHTILEMVASFDNQYLNGLGIEQLNKPRDFHQDVDEAKLRISIRIGCMALAQNLGYVQPVFAGAIQLDRDHPHAHIAMAETSIHTNARKFHDGTEYGCLNKANRNSFIEAVDNSLINMQELAFMPSNQVERAQISAEHYTQNYQLLPAKKQMMLYQAAEDDNAMEPELLKELSLRPFSNKSPQQKKNILQLQHENVDKTHNLPLIYALALQRNTELAQINNPLADIVAKKRRMSAYEAQMKERQKTLLSQFLYFRHSIVNTPQQAQLIETQVLPYYKQAITDTAIKIDYAALFDFKPTQPVPKTFQDQADNLANFKKMAKSPLAKMSFKDAALKTAVNWQMEHQTDSQSVIVVLNSRQDDLKLPYLKSNAVENKRPTDDEFSHQDEVSMYEAGLANNAIQAIQQLPVTSMTKRAHADLNLQIMRSQQHIKRVSMSNKPMKTKSVQPVKSISYKQAEDLLIELT